MLAISIKIILIPWRNYAKNITAGSLYLYDELSVTLDHLTLTNAGTPLFSAGAAITQDLEFINLGRVITENGGLISPKSIRGFGIYVKDGPSSHTFVDSAGSPKDLRVDIVDGLILATAETFESDVTLMGGRFALSGAIYPATIRGNGFFTVVDENLKLIGNDITLSQGLYRVIDSKFYPVIYQDCD